MVTARKSVTGLFLLPWTLRYVSWSLILFIPSFPLSLIQLSSSGVDFLLCVRECAAGLSLLYGRILSLRLHTLFLVFSPLSVMLNYSSQNNTWFFLCSCCDLLWTRLLRTHSTQNIKFSVHKFLVSASTAFVLRLGLLFTLVVIDPILVDGVWSESW